MGKDKKTKNKLVTLLRQAAQHWLALGQQEIWDSEYYADELGKFCNQAADKIEIDNIPDDEMKRLFFIFAPTCEWDDSVGDPDLGEKIFGCLKERIDGQG